MQYSLIDIKSIRDKGVNIKLDEKIMAIIDELLKEVSSPEYNIAPQFNYENKHWLKNNPRKVKDKSDFEILTDSIRISLNKITNQTYENQLKLLNDNLKKFNETCDKDKCVVINELIYNILTKNNFYSDLYSEIYKNLLDDYPFIKEYFDEKKSKLCEELSNINNNLENDSYDEFCDINKDNEMRRALILFYVNLMKKKVVTTDFILILRDSIKFLVLKEIENDERHIFIEELSNLLFIIITNLDPKITNNDLEFIEYLETIIKSKISDYPSLSNKIKFRHMDIKDYLTKK